jgi:DNA-binding response OmpR family regulator
MLSGEQRRLRRSVFWHGFPGGASFAVARPMEASRAGTVVLVAEDDPHALSGYLEFLGRSGFAASGSADGNAALGLALEMVPDIVVSDIMMPGLDGFALAAALRADARTRHLPILGMTGHWTTEIQTKAQRAGFNAMLLKPCLPTHLLAEIERVLRHARLTSAALGHTTVGLEPALPVGLRNAVRRRRAF